MRKQITFTILATLAIIFLAGLTSAQYYDNAYNYRSYNSPYYGGQYSSPYYKDSSFGFPSQSQRNSGSFFDNSRNSFSDRFFSRDSIFSNRDYSNTASSDRVSVFSDARNYNYRDLQDLSRQANTKSKEDYSFNRGPCVTEIIHVNPPGKRSDYSITKKICDDTRIRASNSKVYTDTINDRVLFDYRDSGKSKQEDTLNERSSFTDSFKSRIDRENKNSRFSQQDSVTTKSFSNTFRNYFFY
jgi:hypothetical protein